jgi:hypothetical protein
VLSDHLPRTRSVRRLLALSLAVALTGPIALVAPTGPAAASATDPDSDLGCGSAEVTRTLDTGSSWRMCARIDPIKGLVLEQVQFRPAPGPTTSSDWLPVIDSLYLAQLVVPYDSAVAAFNDVTGFGFGGYALLQQDDRTCLGETMDVEQSFMFGPDLVERTIPGICLDEVGTGLGWSSHDDNDPRADSYVQQGSSLEITSLTKISWYEYQQKVTLTDQGTITVGLGATGDLAPLDPMFSEDPAVGWPINPADNEPARRAQSHWHNAVYRIDFGIGTGEQQVEQWDYAQPDPQNNPAHIEGTGTVRTQAFNAPDVVDPQTWWRVLNPTSLNADGHPRSYEIVNNAIQDPYDALTRPKVSFTNNHPCQEYASDNLNIDCPGLSVPDYVAAETTELTDPVAWVNVGFHHIVRDEDQSPMPAHWQEFSLVPRDLLAQQATTPVERACVNGGPISVYGSCAAVNTVAPRITTGAAVPGVGAVLSSDRGTWRAARAEMTFKRQWLRDGEPISGATGIQHIVGAADLGHRISMRVNATGEGLVPGSATSNELLIPKPGTPTPSPSATPTTKPPTRTTPTLALTLRRKGHPRLQVVVKGKAGAATGTIVVRGPHGWKRIGVLKNGKVMVRIPKALTSKHARLVVRYRGDTHYTPGTRPIRLR